MFYTHIIVYVLHVYHIHKVNLFVNMHGMPVKTHARISLRFLILFPMEEVICRNMILLKFDLP